MTDILGLEAQVAKSIANQVRVNLTPTEGARLAERHAANPVEAYDAFCKDGSSGTRGTARPSDGPSAISVRR